MGIYAQIAVLEGKRWNPVVNKQIEELGWDFETNRQMTTNYRKAFMNFFDAESEIIEIKPSDMDEAIKIVFYMPTVTHKEWGYDDEIGFDFKEKVNFIQIATLCKEHGWSILAC